MGYLLGEERNDRKLYVAHLLIPPQEGDSGRCEVTNYTNLTRLKYQPGFPRLLKLGWIHTHPIQGVFLSSVDIHAQAQMQPDQFMWWHGDVETSRETSYKEPDIEKEEEEKEDCTPKWHTKKSALNFYLSINFKKKHGLLYVKTVNQFYLFLLWHNSRCQKLMQARKLSCK